MMNHTMTKEMGEEKKENCRWTCILKRRNQGSVSRKIFRAYRRKRDGKKPSSVWMEEKY